MFVIAFGTKSCLRVLLRIIDVTTEGIKIKASFKYMKQCQKVGYSSTAPLNQGLFHNEVSWVVAVKPFSSRSYLNFPANKIRGSGKHKKY